MKIDIYAERHDPTIDYMLAVLQAYKDGKKIQSRASVHAQWDANPNPNWNFGSWHYRVDPSEKPKPVMKKVPLELKDLPLDRNIWVKQDNFGTWHLVTACSLDAIFAGGWYGFATLLNTGAIWTLSPLGDDFKSFYKEVEA